MELVQFKEYWLGGISFGFLIANLMKTDKKCKGLFAIEPYLNKKYIRMPWITEKTSHFLLDLICWFKIYERTWKSCIFKNFLLKSGHPEGRIDILLETIDSRTFFETARMIIKIDEKPTFQSKPHILIINKGDQTIKGIKVLDELEKNVDDLLVIESQLDHFPKEMTKKYFKENIREEEMNKIVNFMNNYTK